MPGLSPGYQAPIDSACPLVTPLSFRHGSSMCICRADLGPLSCLAICDGLLPSRGCPPGFPKGKSAPTVSHEETMYKSLYRVLRSPDLTSRLLSAVLQKDPLKVKVNKLTSIKTQLPYEYYSVPFCKPSNIVNMAENLGEVLRGDRIENSEYQVISMLPLSSRICLCLCLGSKSANVYVDTPQKFWRMFDSSMTPPHPYDTHSSIVGILHLFFRQVCDILVFCNIVGSS